MSTCTCHDPVVFGHHHYDTTTPATFRTGETLTITVPPPITATNITAASITTTSYGTATVYINNQPIGHTTGPIHIEYTRPTP